MNAWLKLYKQNGLAAAKCKMSVNQSNSQSKIVMKTVPFPHFNMSNTMRECVATPQQHPHSLVAGTLVPSVWFPRYWSPLGYPESQHRHSPTHFQIGRSQGLDHWTLPNGIVDTLSSCLEASKGDRRCAPRVAVIGVSFGGQGGTNIWGWQTSCVHWVW